MFLVEYSLRSAVVKQGLEDGASQDTVAGACVAAQLSIEVQRSDRHLHPHKASHSPEPFDLALIHLFL